MTEGFYKTYDPFHYHSGGVIYQSDFNTDYRGKDNTHGSTIAQRIESDLRRDEKMYKKYQQMGFK